MLGLHSPLNIRILYLYLICKSSIISLDEFELLRWFYVYIWLCAFAYRSINISCYIRANFVQPILYCIFVLKTKIVELCIVVQEHVE